MQRRRLAVKGSPHAELMQGDRVHRRVYTDPAIFDEEMRRVFGGTWIFAGHESEVPEPGDFKSDTLGRRPVIMVRGKDDAVRLFFNVCRHRGSKVCYESYGNASRFRCMYHGWTYDTTGELIGVPLRERYEDFEPENTLGLIPVPRVESYRGFVFASLNREGPSLAEHLGRGRHYLDLMCERAPDGEIEVTRPIKCDFFGNWKLSIENFSDNYHPSILHRSALEVGVNMLTQKYGDQKITLGNASNYAERTYGAGHGMQDFGRTRGAMWMNAYANPGYLDALQAKHGATRARELAEMDVHIIIYPNLLLATRMNNFRVVKPVAVDRSEVWTYPCKLKGAPADVNEQIVLNASHHVSAMGEIQVDDLQCFTWIQEGLQAEAMEWILLKLHGKDERMNEFGEFEWQGASEEIIRHQYREWLRLMG